MLNFTVVFVLLYYIHYILFYYISSHSNFNKSLKVDPDMRESVEIQIDIYLLQ
jgi:hypothetical protein